jgi:hypothetical protein
MKKINSKNQEEWVDFGNKTKVVRDELNNLIPLASKFLTQKDIRHLLQSEHDFTKFRSICDDRVCVCDAFEPTDNTAIKVFFGEKLIMSSSKEFIEKFIRKPKDFTKEGGLKYSSYITMEDMLNIYHSFCKLNKLTIEDDKILLDRLEKMEIVPDKKGIFRECQLIIPNACYMSRLDKEVE